MDGFMDAVLKRRTRYALSGDATLSDEELDGMLQQLVKNLPTAYNMQSSRLVLLLNGAHQKLWSIVMETLRARVPADKFDRTEQKINSFAAGHGTVLFFDDSAVTEKYKAENPAYAQNFDGWALQQNGMLQFAVWTLLSEQGLGASLQHYNPIIDDEVKQSWGLPAGWTLLAQMPFGKPTAPAGEKTFVPVEERYRVFF